MQNEVNDKPQYAIAAAVHLPGVSDEEFAASLTELRELAKTLGFKVTRTFVQKRAGFDSTAYLGGGKRQEIRRFVHGDADDETGSDDISEFATSGEAQTNAAEVSPEPIDVLFVDHEISPSQARPLENEVG